MGNIIYDPASQKYADDVKSCLKIWNSNAPIFKNCNITYADIPSFDRWSWCTRPYMVDSSNVTLESAEKLVLDYSLLSPKPLISSTTAKYHYGVDVTLWLSKLAGAVKEKRRERMIEPESLVLDVVDEANEASATGGYGESKPMM